MPSNPLHTRAITKKIATYPQHNFTNPSSHRKYYELNVFLRFLETHKSQSIDVVHQIFHPESFCE